LSSEESGRLVSEMQANLDSTAVAPPAADVPSAEPQGAIFRLRNSVQNYDWGSPTEIPQVLGQAPDGQPVAELWLGGHPSAPSVVEKPDGGSIKLDELIRTYPEQMLGERVLNRFGPVLPYLAKLLSAEKALSLQVHPKSHAARAGFNRENRNRVPIDAFHRSFHDAQHKPEMIVALTKFEALAGLRAPRAALKAIAGFTAPLFTALRKDLEADRQSGSLHRTITSLFSNRSAPNRPDLVADALAEVRAKVQAGTGDLSDETVLKLADQFGDDVGIFAPYLLNHITLQPGESLFLEAGEIHAYISGLGVEIMANSDNVLRAGLTSKYVNTEALLECMSFDAVPISRPKQYMLGSKSRGDVYRAPVREFGLTLYDIVPAEPLPLPVSGPKIVLNLDGELTLAHNGGAVTLQQGESVFVPHQLGAVEISGDGHAFAAWVP